VAPPQQQLAPQQVQQAAPQQIAPPQQQVRQVDAPKPIEDKLAAVGFLSAIKAKKVTEKLGPAIPEAFKKELEGFYDTDNPDHAKLLKELKERLRPANTNIGKVPKCNPIVYTTLGYTPGGMATNRVQKSAKAAQNRDAKFQSVAKALMGLNSLAIELMQHPDLPIVPDSVNEHMAEIFSGIAAVYGELHSLRKQFLFEALPYPYREALKLIPTNLMGSLLFRQDDNELSKELMENNKKRKENLDMIQGGNKSRGQNRGGNRFQPYKKGNNRQQNGGNQYRQNGNRQYDNRDQDQDFQRGNRPSRPPQQNKYNNNNKNKGGYNRK
jgi:hypothetical protein